MEIWFTIRHWHVLGERNSPPPDRSNVVSGGTISTIRGNCIFIGPIAFSIHTWTHSSFTVCHMIELPDSYLLVWHSNCFAHPGTRGFIVEQHAIWLWYMLNQISETGGAVTFKNGKRELVYSVPHSKMRSQLHSHIQPSCNLPIYQTSKEVRFRSATKQHSVASSSRISGSGKGSKQRQSCISLQSLLYYY